MQKLTALVALLPGITFAANMTNGITSVGPKGAVDTYICIQNSGGTVTLPLAPGQSGDANKASGNLNYAGATIRFGGCSSNNSYLGYVGFSISDSGNNSISSYSPPEGVHVTFANRAIDSTGKVTGAIEYTPIAYNPDLTPANPAKNWEFAGINLSGLEFGKVIDPVVIPNLSQEDSSGNYSDLKDTQAFIQAGVNTVRVPISWGYLQLDGAGKGSLNMAYYNNYLKPLLQTLTHAKVNTIVDLHAYMRYSEFGKQYSGCGPDGACPDGTLITDVNAYKSVWGQLATLMQNDSSIDKKYLMIDLMNEPVGVPDDKVFTIQAALVKMLQDQKFGGYILVEGNSWTGLHSWTTYQWTGSDGQTYSNATLFTRDNFNKQGVTDLSKVLINVHQYLDSDYSGTHDDCQQDLTTTGPNGFNLNQFVDYLETNKLKAIVTEFGTGRNAASCKAPLTQFMKYLQDNSANGKDYGFVGWTIWSTGHGWGDYNLRVKPTSYQMDVLKDFL
ncbi:Endoglucanase precursor [Legionella massiliensis]|uniref:Endoglucanase n=1 Tax=Legionella massiliensis TaxID=1034943 RepID=A0A078L0Y5_9GAMM|nr:cellulase family glycosylhydrolase [Legionella massiliensis]CDZ78902.1 Endoglucanase precursor [Legionella massiliensis]CEE14640.1 Endoglucanase precursor [Legionella massiliensis]